MDSTLAINPYITTTTYAWNAPRTPEGKLSLFNAFLALASTLGPEHIYLRIFPELTETIVNGKEMYNLRVRAAPMPRIYN